MPVVRARCIGAQIVKTPTVNSTNSTTSISYIETVTVTLEPASAPLNADGTMDTTTTYTPMSGNVVLTGLTDADGSAMVIGKYFHLTIAPE